MVVVDLLQDVHVPDVFVLGALYHRLQNQLLAGAENEVGLGVWGMQPHGSPPGGDMAPRIRVLGEDVPKKFSSEETPGAGCFSPHGLCLAELYWL